jgi:hypothetical protein
MKSISAFLILSGVVCLIRSLDATFAPDSIINAGLLSMAEQRTVLLFPLLSAILISTGTALLAWLDESGGKKWT